MHSNRFRRVCRVSALVEGNSIRSTVRMTGVAKRTVSRLLVELGTACAEYQDKAFVNLKCNRIQCDEIFSFTYAKDKNCTSKMKAKGYGSTWTWVALCSESKLVPCWYVGQRHAGAAYRFMHDLKSRLAHRVQLTTDAHGAYLGAVEDAFGCEIDYAQLIKIYGEAPEESETRYSPPQCLGTRRLVISGSPNQGHISTSYVERQNLTMRMSMRRFTRLTNGFSKKLANHKHALAIHYMYYNFARVHQAHRLSPAMAAGVTGHLWSIEEIVALLDSK
jgi:IS1 family transposase